jgi:IS5 family transposase
MRAVFERSLTLALESGYLKKRKLRVVLDTTNILGRGAVKDTYNLLADGIGQLLRALVKVEAAEVAEWAQEHGLERYLAPSIKGGAEVDWDDEQSRNQFLQGIVADADRLLGMADEAIDQRPEEDDSIQQAAGLLKRLIGQDVERSEKGTTLKEGVARDRVVSVHDPEMRHGRKSSSKRFDGHKATIAVDAESQLITAVEVLPGNAPDREKALELTEASEENTGLEVEETIGDCAFGDGGTRQEFADANRKLVAKVAAYGHRDQISKGAFRIDLDEMTCTCPADQTTSTLVSRGYREDHAGKKHRCQAFVFDAGDCSVCPLRSDCVKAKGMKGRTISLHPQERLLQEARALQDSEAGEEYRQMRQVVEHRLARLVQLGIRQARYFGRKKTLFQLLMAATVANLTLVANKTGQMTSQRGQASPFFVFFKWVEKHLLAPAIGYLSHLRPDRTPAHREKLGSRPGF